MKKNSSPSPKHGQRHDMQTLWWSNPEGPKHSQRVSTLPDKPRKLERVRRNTNATASIRAVAARTSWWPAQGPASGLRSNCLPQKAWWGGWDAALHPPQVSVSGSARRAQCRSWAMQAGHWCEASGARSQWQRLKTTVKSLNQSMREEQPAVVWQRQYSFTCTYFEEGKKKKAHRKSPLVPSTTSDSLSATANNTSSSDVCYLHYRRNTGKQLPATTLHIIS